MNPEALPAELEKEPFVPLRLNLADGSKVDMANPGLSFVNNLALYLARTDRPSSRLVADMRIISLRHILSIEQIDRPTSRPRKIGVTGTVSPTGNRLYMIAGNGRTLPVTSRDQNSSGNIGRFIV